MKTIRTLLLLTIVSLFIACERDPEFYKYYDCQTWPAGNVSFYTAELRGTIGKSSTYGYSSYPKFVFVLSDNSDFRNAQEISAQDDGYSTSYIASVTDLKPNTTYYYYFSAVSANGKNELRGETCSFTTKNLVIPTGAAKGIFAISSSKEVFISKGNLQYQASTATWRFAEHQYDYIGGANSNASATYSGWIDLFGWGTSGYSGYYPYLTSYNVSDYPLWSSIAGTNCDWGVYNAISNGGNQRNKWRTLTASEWSYLINSGSSGYGHATVCGVHGYILLPLYFTKPAGIPWTPYSSYTSYSTNIYDAQAWQKMEEAGAVFLPAAGVRSGTTVSLVEDTGTYWCSDRRPSEGPYNVKFTGTTLIASYWAYYYSYGYYAVSVRLVQDIP